MKADEICFMTARELAESIRRRELSAREVMTAHVQQIAEINPRVNAIVSQLDEERALELADEADRALAAGEPVGPLHGLPIAFKDLEDAVGVSPALWIANLPRQLPGTRHPRCRTAASGRSNRDWQDECARVRFGLPYV